MLDCIKTLLFGHSEMVKKVTTQKFLCSFFFGLGALLGPFIASGLLQRRSWNCTYLVLASFTVVNLITCIFLFLHVKIAEDDQNDLRRQIGIEPNLDAAAVEIKSGIMVTKIAINNH